MLTEDNIRNALREVKYPGYSRDIVSFGLVNQVAVKDGAINVLMQLTVGRPDIAAQIKADSERVLKALPGAARVQVEVRYPGAGAAGGSPAATGPNPWEQQRRVPGIRRIIAVASGKGGVGKSTVSVNLACALRQLGAKVGLLDCDIYGPTIPLMMGVRQMPTLSAQDKMVPPENHGVKLMSMGFLVEGDQPVIWRGPMINKTIQQFFSEVEWGDLDVLVVDLPPGTGDAQLSVCQTVPLDGGVIVSTPQGGVAGRGAQRDRDVPKGQCAHPWHCGEHELLHHPRRGAGGNLRPRRRAGRGEAAAGPVSGGSPAVHRDSGGGRPGGAGGGRRRGSTGREGVCGDCPDLRQLGLSGQRGVGEGRTGCDAAAAKNQPQRLNGLSFQAACWFCTKWTRDYV